MHHEVCGHEHLHVHTMFSLLDGYQTPLEAAQRVKANGSRFLTVTDHGAMGAVPQQIKACDQTGLSPIYGCELYYNPLQPAIRDDADQKAFVAALNEDEKKRFNKNYHLLAIAYNQQGYSNLVRLSSWGYIYGYGGRPVRPRVNKDMLLAHREGIIFTSCCYASEIGVTFDWYGEDAAMDKVAEYVAMFGTNFRLELMMLDFVKQKPYDRFIIKAHQKFGIPLIISQDAHYSNPEDSHMQRLMLMIQTGKTIQEVYKLQNEGADLFELQDSQLWMKSEPELNTFWEKEYSDVIDYELFKQAKRETVAVCEIAKGVTLDRSSKLPNIPDAENILKEKTKEGFIHRNCPRNAKYLNRLQEELELICRKGFASYFLVQKQMTDEARRVAPSILGWGDGSDAVGPGRGCLAGDVPIVLESGRTKPISEIVKGDRVPTHDGTIQTVVNTFVYDVKETLLKIKSYYGDAVGVTLTKDHKVYAERMKRPKNFHNWSLNTQRQKKTVLKPEGNLEWIPAGELQVGDWVYIPPVKHTTSQSVQFDLGVFCNDHDLIKYDQHVEQLTYNHLTGTFRDRKISRRFIEIDEDWACVLGIFAADGWLRSNGTLETGFVFHIDDQEHLDFVEKTLRFQGFDRQTISHTEGKACVQLRVNSRFLHLMMQSLFADYRHTPETKHVPDLIKNLRQELVHSFLNGYHSGDGNRGEHKTTASTISRRLADEVRYLMAKSSVPTSLGYENRKDDREDFQNIKPSYIVRSPKDKRIYGDETSRFQYCYHLPECGGIMTRIRSIEEVEGINKVYDFEVENSHSFLTSSFVVHNSACGALTCFCLGITDVDPIKHDLLFSRFLSEARGGKTMKLRFTNIDPILPDKTGYSGYSVDDGQTWQDGL